MVKLKTFNGSLINTQLLPEEQNEKELVESRIWTSIKMEEAADAFRKGSEYEMGNPFFEKDLRRKKAELVFQRTDEEREDYKRVFTDIEYFAETYTKIKTQEGSYTNYKLRPYQKNFITNQYDKHRFNIWLASRQIGKSIITGICIMHYIITNTEKNILILANKGATVLEILTKIKDIYDTLPYFLKPGIVKWNEGEVIFDNKVRIITSTTTKNSGVGFTVDFLFADEFALVEDNIARLFWKSIYPTLTSLNNSKCIITSTANGHNLFYEMYTRSVAKKNNFGNFITYWWEVEGRGEDWKKEQIEALGGNEILFEQEFNCQFLSSGSLLLDSDTLRNLTLNKIEYESLVLDEFEQLVEETEIPYEKILNWDVAYFNKLKEAGFENSRYLLTIDLSEGDGGDFQVINIWCVERYETKEEIAAIKNPKDERDFIKLRQFGLYRTKEHPKKHVAEITWTLVNMLGLERTVVSFEYNHGGDYFYKCLEEKEDFYSDIVVHSKHRTEAVVKKPGIKITSNKNEYNQEMKKLIKSNYIQVNEFQTIEEFSKFGKNSNSNKKAAAGLANNHDDTVATVLQIIPVYASSQFRTMCEDTMQYYPKEILDAIDSIVYGYLNASMNSNKSDYYTIPISKLFT